MGPESIRAQAVAENLPVLLAGRGGPIEGGRHIHHNGRPPADLHLALLQHLGVKRDSTGPLPQLRG